MLESTGCCTSCAQNVRRVEVLSSSFTHLHHWQQNGEQAAEQAALRVHEDAAEITDAIAEEAFDENDVPQADVDGAATAVLGMAVDGEDEQDDDDEWEDCTDSEEEEEDSCKIGLVEAPSIPEALKPEYFPSKVGGDPAWLDPENLPAADDLRCQASVKGEVCGRRLVFLLQIYAPLNEGPPEAFHRSVFLFICSNPLCAGKQGSCRAFRCQLPRRNPFYSFEPPEYPDERPKIVQVEEQEDAAAAAADSEAMLQAGRAAVSAGRGLKEEGNASYKENDYHGAVGKYTEALEAMRAAVGSQGRVDSEGSPTQRCRAMRPVAVALKSGCCCC